MGIGLPAEGSSGNKPGPFDGVQLESCYNQPHRADFSDFRADTKQYPFIIYLTTCFKSILVGFLRATGAASIYHASTNWDTKGNGLCQKTAVKSTGWNLESASNYLSIWRDEQVYLTLCAPPSSQSLDERLCELGSRRHQRWLLGAGHTWVSPSLSPYFNTLTVSARTGVRAMGLFPSQKACLFIQRSKRSV